jgi:hypothetical protein
MTLGVKRNANRDLVWKSGGQGPLSRHRCAWVDGNKGDLKEMGWEGVDWINLAQDRDKCQAVVITVMNLRAP